MPSSPSSILERVVDTITARSGSLPLLAVQACAVAPREMMPGCRMSRTAAGIAEGVLAAGSERAAVGSIGELVAVVGAVDMAAAGSEEVASADRVSGFEGEVEAGSGVADTGIEAAAGGQKSRCVVEESVNMTAVVPVEREGAADRPPGAVTAAAGKRVEGSAEVAAADGMLVVRVADCIVEVVLVADLVDELVGNCHRMVVRLPFDLNMSKTAAEAAQTVEEGTDLQGHC